MFSNQFLNEIYTDLRSLRRHLHAHPELSGEENQTAALIAGELRNYGWRVRERIGRTGVVADIGPANGPLLGLRVDMDALPIEERTGLKYSSLREGVMHACGHDLHICIGLGLARLLSVNKNISHGVRLLFQPAEEIAQGARWMRSDGALEGLNALFGVHVYPELEVGKIGIKDGCLTAAAGELEIEVIGEGGHGARPHQSIDSIWVASHIVTGLQEAISRQIDALDPVVISFGAIRGGRAFNVIADRVKLLGTVRCLNSQLYEELPKWIEDTVQSISNSLGAKSNIKYKNIAPPVYNNPKLNDLLEKSAVSILGPENVIRLEKPSLGAEDFAELLQDLPGTMFRLGVAGENGCAPLHNGQFNPDEKSIAIGIEILYETFLTWMKDQNKLSDKSK